MWKELFLTYEEAPYWNLTFLFFLLIPKRMTVATTIPNIAPISKPTRTFCAIAPMPAPNATKAKKNKLQNKITLPAEIGKLPAILPV